MGAGQRGDDQSLQQLELDLQGKLADETLTIELKRLALARPALSASGSSSFSAGGLRLALTGEGIDVAAVRTTAMAIGGDIAPVAQLFRYLVAGTVTRLVFSAAGTTPAELLSLHHLQLEGHLQAGQIAVPQIDLELAEVSGDWRLVDGVLQGHNLAARRGRTTGENGTLALGLAGGSDLFSLKMLLDADLVEMREMLIRLLPDTRLATQLGRVSRVTGHARGWLLLGESFSTLTARLEQVAPQLSLRHPALPFPVAVDGGQLDYRDGSLVLHHLDGSFGASRITGLSGIIDWRRSLTVDIAGDSLQLLLDELFPWLKRQPGVKRYLAGVVAATGKVAIEKAYLSGAMDRWAASRYGLSARVEGGVLRTTGLPGEVKIPQAVLRVQDRELSWQQGTVAWQESLFEVKGGRVRGGEVEVSVDGTLGPEAAGWLMVTGKVPAKYQVKAPLSLSTMRLWRNAAKAIGLNGEVRLASGVVAHVDAALHGSDLQVRQLTIAGGGAERAQLEYRQRGEDFTVSFAGALDDETLQKIFTTLPFSTRGRIAGEFTVDMPGQKDIRPNVSGRLNGSDWQLPLPGGGSLSLARVALQAEGARVTAAAENLRWGDYLVSPVRGTVELLSRGIAANVEQAEFCSIPMTGTGSYGAGVYALEAEVAGRNLHSDSVYTCLTRGLAQLTGTVDVRARIATRGPVEGLVAGINGPVTLHFRNGLIKKDRVLAAVLAVLNVTEIVKGRLPTFAADGFRFNEIEIDGVFRAGILEIGTIRMDGEVLDLLGQGAIDLNRGTIDVQLLAAPFKTADSVIRHIPVVNSLLNDSLVAIPLSVSGRLTDPEVRVMSLSSVSRSLLALAERTVKLPLKLIRSLLPGK
ncbi:MAG: AsmA-like C-terminal domain-containing protein [Desulfopila sp.]